MFAPLLGEKRLAVAVSGGSDSMALLLLVRAWAAEHGAHVVALTVDHGLRDEAAEEAAQVGRWCVERGVESVLLPLEGGAAEQGAAAGDAERRGGVYGEAQTHPTALLRLSEARNRLLPPQGGAGLWETFKPMRGSCAID